MQVVLCTLALASGAIGAGFASGREIARFFAGHGPFCAAAALCALAAMGALLARLPDQMERSRARTLPGLCRARFGRRLGALCGALFLLLSGVTGGAMLAACAELCALTLPLRHAYGMGLAVTLALAAALCALGVRALAAPGLALCALLPPLMLRLLALPAGEARLAAPDASLARAVADGAAYGALNAAMLCGEAPLLLSFPRRLRRRAALLFCALFGALLFLGIAVCRRHLQAVRAEPMPFVALCRRLGAGGYALCAAALYAAAFSTLCTMLAALAQPLPRRAGLPAAMAVCLAFSRVGFSNLVASLYPTLGAVCAALLLLLCLPAGGQKVSSSCKYPPQSLPVASRSAASSPAREAGALAERAQ